VQKADGDGGKKILGLSKKKSTWPKQLQGQEGMLIGGPVRLLGRSEGGNKKTGHDKDGANKNRPAWGGSDQKTNRR